MQQLIKDNKLQQLDVDINNLNKPQKPFEFDDFSRNQFVKKIIKDNKIGFVVTNQMMNMPKKYLVMNTDEGDKEIKPLCFPYWYRPQSSTNEAKADEVKTKVNKNEIDPTYFIGLIMYDETSSYVDEFVNLISIETSLCVKESAPLLKAMLNDWALHTLNKSKDYKGICAKPTHPKMKAMLLKLGFSTMKDNKDILMFKL